ncbi:MAG: addiction module protein, partial [Cyanobium sp.]
MAVALPLAEMRVHDKLQAMEQLWADLSQKPEQLASPAWHGEVLRSRRDQVLQVQGDLGVADARQAAVHTA